MFSLGKQSRKIMLDYFIALFLYGMFFPIVIVIGKDNFTKGIPYYSAFLFLLFVFIIWPDAYEMGRKENKKVYGLNPSINKGALIGFLGFLPFMILQIAAVIFAETKGVELGFNQNLTMLFHNIFLAPVYFVSVIFAKTTIGYIISYFTVPIITYFAYRAGHKNITTKGFKKFLKKLEKYKFWDRDFDE